MKKDFFGKLAVLSIRSVIFVVLVAVIIFGAYGAVRYLFAGGI